MQNSPKLLVTAGATRNPIDAVRFLSANSSGKTGVFLASAFQEHGFEVTLMGSVEACLRAQGLVQTVAYGSTRDLMKKMEDWVRQTPNGVVIHAAAVGDYEVVTGGSQKIRSGQDTLSLQFQPTPKIAALLRGWGLTGTLVTFKAASPEVQSDELIAIAKRQRQITGSDWVFANVLGKLETQLAVVGETVWPFSCRKEALDHLVVSVLSTNRLHQ
jgi:phosphopantothenoylcysteine decarboxylase/phosphopantothenate--cysteine ligase